jgi:hypothetical protein
MPAIELLSLKVEAALKDGCEVCGSPKDDPTAVRAAIAVLDRTGLTSHRSPSARHGHRHG